MNDDKKYIIMWGAMIGQVGGVVTAFTQEKALVEAFSVIVKRGNRRPLAGAGPSQGQTLHLVPGGHTSPEKSQTSPLTTNL